MTFELVSETGKFNSPLDSLSPTPRGAGLDKKLCTGRTVKLSIRSTRTGGLNAAHRYRQGGSSGVRHPDGLVQHPAGPPRRAAASAPPRYRPAGGTGGPRSPLPRIAHHARGLEREVDRHPGGSDRCLQVVAPVPLAPSSQARKCPWPKRQAAHLLQV